MDSPNEVVSPESPTEPEAELVALRERVSQLERLAAVGQLTAGILHEIRNPLNFVVNFAKLSAELLDELGELGDKLPDAADADDFADVREMLAGNLVRIRENGDRAERIIQGMLAQTRGETPYFIPTDLNALLEEFTKLAYQGLRAADKEFNVTLVFQLDPGVGLVSLAPHEFNRVVLNLVLNACYAVNEHRQHQPPAYRPTITVSSRRAPGGIEVRIRDNGPGIAPEVQHQLFTPFFTTKPAGLGTGLGLSISRDIVQHLHRGQLSVESAPGVFTEFCVQLPLESAGN